MKELQGCYSTQLSGDNGKSNWIIYNKDKEKIYELPKHWTEKDTMKAIHFARDFENKSFEEGVEYGKKIKENEFKVKEVEFANIKSYLEGENLRLAQILDNLIGEK